MLRVRFEGDPAGAGVEYLEPLSFAGREQAGKSLPVLGQRGLVLTLGLGHWVDVARFAGDKYLEYRRYRIRFLKKLLDLRRREAELYGRRPPTCEDVAKPAA